MIQDIKVGDRFLGGTTQGRLYRGSLRIIEISQEDDWYYYTNVYLLHPPFKIHRLGSLTKEFIHQHLQDGFWRRISPEEDNLIRMLYL